MLTIKFNEVLKTIFITMLLLFLKIFSLEFRYFIIIVKQCNKFKKEYRTKNIKIEVMNICYIIK